MWNRHDFDKDKKQRFHDIDIFCSERINRGKGSGPILAEYNEFVDQSKPKVYGVQKYAVPKSQEYLQRTERIKAFKDPRQKNIFYNVMSPNKDVTRRMIESDFLQELGQFPNANKFDLNRKLSEKEIQAAKDEEKRQVFLKAYKNHQNIPVGMDIEDKFLRWIGQCEGIETERFKVRECNIFERYIICYANKQPVPKFMTKDGKRPPLKEIVSSPRFGDTIQQKYGIKQKPVKDIYECMVFKTSPQKVIVQDEHHDWRSENWAKDLQVLHPKDDSADRFRIKEIFAESDHQHEIFVNQIEQLENVSEEVKGLLHELKGFYEEHKWCLDNDYDAEYIADKNNPLTSEEEEKNKVIKKKALQKEYKERQEKIKKAIKANEPQSKYMKIVNKNKQGSDKKK